VRENPRPMAWYPFTQSDSPGNMTVELRVHGDPTAILPAAQRVVQDFGPDLPLMQPMTQQEQYDLSISQDKLVARLSTFFGILAALLVATGLYGTLAYRVNRRTSEIGVRMALGAQRAQVLWMILRESLLLCAIGAAVGLPLSFAAARLLRSMLFEMSPGDPLSFVAALLGVAAVAMAAGLIPARRASSVDPMIALRYE
ncbi:MAG TPA: FtsX-like permease family protein, partial [Terriglobales bacterium]|nr:FtsX-like permease family protein [Terriglobales bacterium]